MALDPGIADNLTLYEWFCYFYGWQKRIYSQQRFDMERTLMFVNTQLKKPITMDDIFGKIETKPSKQRQAEDRKYVDKVFSTPNTGNTPLDRMMESLGVVN